MIKYFAVCTEFAIARIARIALRVVILFLKVRIFVLFTLLLLCLIVAVVVVLLRPVTLLLLTLLEPESCEFLLCEFLLSGIVAGVLIFVDDVDQVPLLLVTFDPVVGEECVVGVVDRHPCLILVRKQFSDIFRSGGPEDLCEEELVVGPDTVIGEGREHVLGVGTLWLKGCRTFRFDPVGSVVLVERVE